MSWYYNSNTGAINEETQFFAWPELHLGVGWHGPFNSKDEAIQFYQNGKTTNPGWKEPTGIAGNLKNALTVGNLLQPFGSHGINLASWFIRIGEILIGLVLIGVGLAQLTGASNFVSSAVKAKI